MIEIEKAKTEKLAEIIAKSKNILLLTHTNPDGDTVGAALGLGLLLGKKNKNVTIVSPDEVPDFLEWMRGADDIIVYSGNKAAVEKAFQASDLVFCMDFNAAHRTGDMSVLLENSTAVKVLIDHHLFPDEKFFDLMFSFPEVSSTSELLFTLLKESGFSDGIDKDIATAIFVGIMTDTGSFAHSCDRKEVFEITAELIDKGLKVKETYDKVYNSYSESRLRFLGYAISEKLVVISEKKAAYIWISLSEMQHYGVNEGDLEGLVNYALSIKGIELAILLKEKADFIKLSFRSKKDFSVNKFAREHFDGGGHFNAAGGRSYISMKETIEKLELLIHKLNI